MRALSSGPSKQLSPWGDVYKRQIMDDLRSVVDYTETITDRTYWPVPSYNNMLFYV